MADKFNLDGFAVSDEDVCTADGGFVGTLTGVVLGGFTSYTEDGEINSSDSIASIFPISETLEMELPDGLDGQQMTIMGDGGSFNVVVTPANLSGGTNITFDASGEYADLVFVTSQWIAYRTNATVA
jgi:hypothetical protein